MQKENRIAKGHISICIVAVLLLVLTVCGSIWDWEIANAIYLGEKPSENPFGVICSFIGIIPTFVGWSFLGASIICLSKRQVKDAKKRGWLIAFSVVLFVLSFFYFCNTLYMSNANSVKIPFVVAYSIGIAVICAAAYLGYKLSAKSEGSTLLKKALFLAAVSLITLLVISSTKKIMNRPRFRFVLAMDNADFFRNWWQSGRGLKSSLGTSAVSDEFSSLPSGHSAYSMFAIFIFPILAEYVRGLKKAKPYLFAFGVVWWMVIALSRMTVGAHYLTDVAIGGLVTILSYIIATLVRGIYLKRKAKRN